MAGLVRNIKNLMQILKSLRSQDQNEAHSHFCQYFKNKQELEEDWEASTVSQINKADISK